MNSEWNVSNVLAGAANGASNNVKAAALPPGSTAVTPNSSSAAPVKTVSLPATPVMKVTHSSPLSGGDSAVVEHLKNTNGNI